jgi:hypothetical protein
MDTDPAPDRQVLETNRPRSHYIPTLRTKRKPVLEFLTIYGGQEPSRNRVVVPAHQAT